MKALNINALIVAAGKGKRMGTKIKKQYLELSGVPILIRTVNAFKILDYINNITLIVSPDDAKYCSEEILKKNGLNNINIVKGGVERQDSVYNGLKACHTNTDYVIVHDGVRPFINSHTIKKSIDEAIEHKAAVVGVPVKDTIKEVDENGFVMKTPDRKKLWAVQTPQVFDYKILLEAYEKAFADNFYGTDDSTLVERLGYSPVMVEGSYSNIKITTYEDMKIAQSLL